MSVRTSPSAAASIEGVSGVPAAPPMTRTCMLPCSASRPGAQGREQRGQAPVGPACLLAWQRLSRHADTGAGGRMATQPLCPHRQVRPPGRRISLCSSAVPPAGHPAAAARTADGHREGQAVGVAAAQPAAQPAACLHPQQRRARRAGSQPDLLPHVERLHASREGLRGVGGVWEQRRQRGGQTHYDCDRGSTTRAHPACTRFGRQCDERASVQCGSCCWPWPGAQPGCWSPHLGGTACHLRQLP